MNTEVKPQNLINVSLATLVVYALVTLLTFILITVVSAKKQTYLAPLIFGNTGNVGLPLSYFAYGPEGLDYAVIIFALMTVYAFTFGIWVVAGRNSVTLILKEPVCRATILGGLF